jgi:hypothetical protein
MIYLDTVCPTRYRTRHFFNNSNTNEDIATKFEQGYARCVRNEEECVCSMCVVRLIVATWSSGPNMPGLVASGTHYLFIRRKRFYGDLISPTTVKRTWVFVWISPYFYSILTKFGTPRQIFVEAPDIKFDGNPFIGSRVRMDELAFREFAEACNMYK